MSQLLTGVERALADAVPDHVRESEIAEAERRIAVLSFVREYLVLDEVYRLGEFDLRFADLLPDDPPFDCGCVSASTVRAATALETSV